MDPPDRQRDRRRDALRFQLCGLAVALVSRACCNLPPGRRGSIYPAPARFCPPPLGGRPAFTTTIVRFALGPSKPALPT